MHASVGTHTLPSLTHVHTHHQAYEGRSGDLQINLGHIRLEDGTVLWSGSGGEFGLNGADTAAGKLLARAAASAGLEGPELKWLAADVWGECALIIGQAKCYSYCAVHSRHVPPTHLMRRSAGKDPAAHLVAATLPHLHRCTHPPHGGQDHLRRQGQHFTAALQRMLDEHAPTTPVEISIRECCVCLALLFAARKLRVHRDSIPPRGSTHMR